MVVVCCSCAGMGRVGRERERPWSTHGESDEHFLSDRGAPLLSEHLRTERLIFLCRALQCVFRSYG